MAGTTAVKSNRTQARNWPTQESDAIVAEVIEALLEPDRAHHDELGRTAEASRTPDRTSPREQPAVPLDVDHSPGE
jgi:hypothetical protein